MIYVKYTDGEFWTIWECYKYGDGYMGRFLFNKDMKEPPSEWIYLQEYWITHDCDIISKREVNELKAKSL